MVFDLFSEKEGVPHWHTFEKWQDSKGREKLRCSTCYKKIRLGGEYVKK